METNNGPQGASVAWALYTAPPHQPLADAIVASTRPSTVRRKRARPGRRVLRFRNVEGGCWMSLWSRALRNSLFVWVLVASCDSGVSSFPSYPNRIVAATRTQHAVTWGRIRQ